MPLRLRRSWRCSAPFVRALSAAQRCLAGLRRGLGRFGREESGAVTVELVLWLPILAYVAMMMLALNNFLTTASEVQQVANEVARATVGRFQAGETAEELCQRMHADILPRVVSGMVMVRTERFKPFQAGDCSRDADDLLTVVVTYRLDGSALQRMGRMMGLSLGTIRRSSVVQL